MVPIILSALARIKADVAVHLQAASIQRLCAELDYTWGDHVTPGGGAAGQNILFKNGTDGLRGLIANTTGPEANSQGIIFYG